MFVVTWLLHAYQWFWLRGAVSVQLERRAVLDDPGALVVVNSLREWRQGRARSLSVRALPWSETLALGRGTVAMFCTISVLWSLWSTESLATWLSLWSAAGHWPSRASMDGAPEPGDASWLSAVDRGGEGAGLASRPLGDRPRAALVAATAVVPGR